MGYISKIQEFRFKIFHSNVEIFTKVIGWAKQYQKEAKENKQFPYDKCEAELSAYLKRHNLPECKKYLAQYLTFDVTTRHTRNKNYKFMIIKERYGKNYAICFVAELCQYFMDYRDAFEIILTGEYDDTWRYLVQKDRITLYELKNIPSWFEKEDYKMHFQI